MLPPPVELDRFSLEAEKNDYYVTASRLVPYKRVDLIVKAFAHMPERRLVVVGDGPEIMRIRAAAQGHPNITILGYCSDPELKQHVSKARAFVFAAIERFRHLGRRSAGRRHSGHRTWPWRLPGNGTWPRFQRAHRCPLLSTD